MRANNDHAKIRRDTHGNHIFGNLIPDTDSRIETTGHNVDQSKGPVFDFAPAIDTYLKEHLFGDIFGRDNLSYEDREIATLGALAVLEGVEPQLMSHFNISLNIGLTETQSRGVIVALENSACPVVAQRATSALEKVLAASK